LLPARLQHIHDELTRLIEINRPDCIAIENLFHAKNVKSALTLGHARGVAVLAAVHTGRPIVEYTPAEIKVSVTGYGRADKTQIQHMVKQWLKLDAAPKPHDAADALAIALCHVHSSGSLAGLAKTASRAPRQMRSWRHVTVEQLARRLR
jgi:crossover junction endodeoxyribonuclease RuvC